MSTYYFRPVVAGICAACNEFYPALVGRVHLTADGIVHPDCDEQADPHITYSTPKLKQKYGQRRLALVDRCPDCHTERSKTGQCFCPDTEVSDEP